MDGLKPPTIIKSSKLRSDYIKVEMNRLKLKELYQVSVGIPQKKLRRSIWSFYRATNQGARGLHVPFPIRHVFHAQGEMISAHRGNSCLVATADEV